MSNILKLPNEILRLILSLLKTDDNKDIKQCALTCQTWKPIAQELLFSTITFKDNGDVNNFLKIYTINPNLGKFVKLVDYNPDEVITENPVANLFVFARIFPNLEEFRDIVPNKLFISCFQRLLLDGDFPRLKTLPKPYTRSEDKVHLTNLKCIKDRITTLDLWQNKNTRRDIYTPLQNELYQFTQLHTISIIINTSEPHTIMEYMDTLNAIKSLRKAHFEFNFPINVNIESYNIVPITHLKDLTVDCDASVLLGYDINLIYLMKKFPNLRSLVINNPIEKDTEQTVNNEIAPSVEVIEDFLKYIAKIPNHNLKYFVCHANNTRKLIKDYYNNTNNQPSYFIKDALILQREEIGPRTLDGNAAFALKNNINTKERNVSVNFYGTEYVYKYFEVLQDTKDYNFRYLQLTNDSALSTLALIERVLELCPHLPQLSISGPAIESIEEVNYEDKKHNLKYLQLADFTKNFFPYITHRFPLLESLNLCRYDSSDTSADGLIRISLNDMSLRKLTIKLSSPIDSSFMEYFGIFIKLTTTKNQQTQYFYIAIENSGYYTDENELCKLHEATSTEYDESIEDEDYSNYDISCGSVDEVTLEYNLGTELLLYRKE